MPLLIHKSTPLRHRKGRTMKLLFVVIFIFSSTAHSAADSFESTVDAYMNSEIPIVVPAGNMNSAVQSFDVGKYKNVVRLISKKSNICVIKEAAQLYGVDPIAIVGAIVGEHTYNVDAWDIGQNNYMYMLKNWIKRFEANGIDLAEMFKEDMYFACTMATDNNYDLWGCYESVWKNDKRNPRKGQSKSSIKWVFFNPIGTGYTYGFGQLGPERAFMVTDIVHQISGFPQLTLEDPPSLYDAILNPQTSIHYVAATNRKAIDIYKEVANFDISQNPGIISTLYNLGKEYEKAEELYQRTLKSLAKNERAKYPQVNYYGWFINSKESELRDVYKKATEKAGCQ